MAAEFLCDLDSAMRFVVRLVDRILGMYVGVSKEISHKQAHAGAQERYRSIQNDYRQTSCLRAINSNYRCRIALPEELISITETDLWEFQQKISHYRYRFSPEFQFISVTDTDFGLETN